MGEKSLISEIFSDKVMLEQNSNRPDKISAISAIPVQCSTNWAMEPYGAGHIKNANK